MMTKNERKVTVVLKEAEDWLTVQQISKLTGMYEANVRNILRRKYFDYLERTTIDTKRREPFRYLTAYRLPQHNADKAQQAITLAKQYQGVFGQLYWTKPLNPQVMA